MPNYVLNKIELTGNLNAISEMLEKIQNDTYGKGTIDFNKVIPMPETLNIEHGSRTDTCILVYLTNKGTIEFEDLSEEDKKLAKTLTTNIFNANYLEDILKKICGEDKEEYITDENYNNGKQYVENYKNYGATTWYGWSLKNWGTKWNACGYDEGIDYSNDDYLEFETAWSAPHPVIEKLAKDYPDITFIHRWADEDLGYNCGMIGYANGRSFMPTTPDAYLEDFEFACEVWGYDPEEIRKYY